MRSGLDAVAAGAAGLLAGALLLGCAGSTGVDTARPASASRGAPDDRTEAWARLVSHLERFEVAGSVRTEQGHVLPENIVIEIRSEVCVESRDPGARFWSLDYDTCFVWVARESVDARGEYSVGVPCLDADRTYESRHEFGELRLVQRGPVTYVAESDAGWRMQDTFASSRSQRRDLVLELDTDRFFVVEPEAVLRERPRAEAPELGTHRFGKSVDVLRFHQGWAECLMDGRIGWMEMRFLGTEDEMKERAPRPPQPPLRGQDRAGGEAGP
jgi:hypothetical protein